MTYFQKFCAFVLASFLSIFFFQQCKSAQIAAEENPAAPGFNTKDSDPEAIAIADAVMRAQGGRKAWDETRVITWDFFGSRRLTWDKKTGDVRIEWLKKLQKVIVNLNTGAGKVSLRGVEQNHPDSLKKYLDIGKKVWINDSYWLVMPFKLKDSGVTLKYKGTSKTDDGREADLLQLTFAGVGVTPENKYHVWVDKQTRLVSQWAYFEKFDHEKPELTNPWTDYKAYGKIRLSGNRGRKEGNLENIAVLESAPPGTFEKL